MAKITAERVYRDEQGDIIKQEPINVFAVVTDVATRTSETMDSGVVEIVAFFFNRVKGLLKVFVMLGGDDAGGNFHPDPKYRDGVYTLRKVNPEHLDMWNGLNLDTRQDFNFDELRTFMQNQGLVERLFRDVWEEANVETTLIP